VVSGRTLIVAVEFSVMYTKVNRIIIPVPIAPALYNNPKKDRIFLVFLESDEYLEYIFTKYTDIFTESHIVMYVTTNDLTNEIINGKIRNCLNITIKTVVPSGKVIKIEII
jgi:hypothetical protein